MISYGDCETYYPVRIVMTDEVIELMKSKEAQSYVKQIERAGNKLKKFIEENKRVRGCSETPPGAA